MSAEYERVARHLKLVDVKEQPDLFEDPGVAQLRVYMRQAGETARKAGHAAAKSTDPEGFGVALDAIAELADSGRHFSADDLRATGVRGNTIGAAFGAARK